MTATLSAVIAASLLGSLHCAGMCGGFAALCGGARGANRRGVMGQVAYNGGRLVSYVALGALAGLLAGRFDAVAEGLLGMQRVATWILVAALVLMALRELGLGRRAELVGIDDPQQRPGPLARLRLRVTGLLRRPGAGPALAVGLLSAVLPCGWLWAFVAVAGTTGEALSGALVMGVFWLGTLPALVVVGGLARLVGDRVRRHARLLTAGALLLAAGVALAGKTPTPQRVAKSQGQLVEAPADAPAADPNHDLRCH